MGTVPAGAVQQRTAARHAAQADQGLLADARCLVQHAAQQPGCGEDVGRRVKLGLVM